ncbi:MAG: hypothetical protein ABIL06_15180, partial [Pseudomonadota bacterium]
MPGTQRVFPADVTRRSFVALGNAAETGVGFQMIKPIMSKICFVIIAFFIFGCAEHKVDTFQEWCEQISGENLDE